MRRSSFRRIGTLIRVFGVLIAITVGSKTSPAYAAPSRSDPLTVSLLTMGPGDHPFFKFGHNAVWVHDDARGTDRVYNYGTFAFDSPTLIVDFLKGRFQYWLSVQSLKGTLAHYARENRSISAQELRLTPAEKRELVSFLEWNARDENKFYKYDYYRDNCSTRIRDLIDRVTHGRLRAAAQSPASMTLRAHTERLTSHDIPVYLGLDVAMGDAIDEPILVWDEMFLPSKLHDTLRLATGATSEGGRPLVRSERELVQANREPMRSTPPEWTLQMLLFGALIGGLVAALGAAGARGHRVASFAYAFIGGGLGLVAGVLGTLFVLLWAFTDHRVAFANENVLQLAPWALLAPVFVVGAVRRHPTAMKLTYWLAMGLFASSAFGLLAKVLPAFDQRNGPFIALMLPAWAGFLWGARKYEMSRIGHQVSGIGAPRQYVTADT